MPYAAREMYALVADVERYPGFLPWCRSVEVHERDGDEVEASLEIARGPMRKKFTTRNRMVPDRSIEMHLVRGPFSRLEGRWRFLDLDGAGCRVELYLDFEFSSAVLARLLAPVFNEIAQSMVDAFCRRARAVHGSA